MKIKIQGTYATKAGGKNSLNQTDRKRKLKRKAEAYFTEIFLGLVSKNTVNTRIQVRKVVMTKK